MTAPSPRPAQVTLLLRRIVLWADSHWHAHICHRVERWTEEASR